MELKISNNNYPPKFTELLLKYYSYPHPTPLPMGDTSRTGKLVSRVRLRAGSDNELQGAVVNEPCEIYNGGRGYKISNKKVTIPQFTGYRSVLSKKLDKTIQSRKCSKTAREEIINDLTKFIRKKARTKRILGEGFFNSVYKIDDKYALKRSSEAIFTRISDFKINRNLKFKNLKHYFGEFIANIYDAGGDELKILRNVYSKGRATPVGIPRTYAKTHTYPEGLKYYYENCLPILANLPQRSFDGIAKDCAQLNKMCTRRTSYTFYYCNPNNFVLTGKTLRILDDIDVEHSNKRNSVANLLKVFINQIDLDYFAVYNPEQLPLRKLLAKKIILAGVRHELPMYSCMNDLDEWNYLLQHLLEIRISDELIKNTADIFDTIIKENKNPQKRVQIAKIFLENNLGL
ncbi:hypothetical protein IJ541_11235 [bacterium]|nr:hypothetical protein [bacterium]